MLYLFIYYEEKEMELLKDGFGLFCINIFDIKFSFNGVYVVVRKWFC